MSERRDEYQSPLAARYASREMRFVFSDEKKFTTWRRLWIALAESEQELGLDITDEQLSEMRAHVDDVDYEAAARHEGELRHDVMAHILAFGEQCPTARPILHLGATSCFVGDNTDLVCLRDGLTIVKQRLVEVIRRLKEFALEWRSLPTLGLTHYQPAQATTVGKRACLWLQDLVHDLEDLEYALSRASVSAAIKGSVGDPGVVPGALRGRPREGARARPARDREALGFERTFGVTGQTYPQAAGFPRRHRSLSSIAQSAHKFATDLRLLAGNRREMEEPFEDEARSARPPCPGSATRCARSACARSSRLRDRGPG